MWKRSDHAIVNGSFEGYETAKKARKEYIELQRMKIDINNLKQTQQEINGKLDAVMNLLLEMSKK